MAAMKLLLGADVLVDFLDEGESFDEARLLLAMGYVGEASLWVPATQLADLARQAADGKKKKAAAQIARLKEITAFVNVCSFGEDELAAVLDAPVGEGDAALVNAFARDLRVDAVITNEKLEGVRAAAYTPKAFFSYLKNEKGLDYEAISLA